MRSYNYLMFHFSMNEYNYVLRGKRSLRDLFYGKRLSQVPWGLFSKENMQRGKKTELRHLPWQMDLSSPMLRG